MLRYVPFFNTVDFHAPLNPIEYEDGNTISKIISKYSPEFTDKATSLMNPLLFNGHLQTAMAGLNSFANVDKIWYKRKLLKYEDGGEGTVDFMVPPIKDFRPEANMPKSQVRDLPPRTQYFSNKELRSLEKNDSKPMLIVLHGLSGGSYEAYVRCLLNEITKHGFEACVLNARGCAQSSITTPQLFNGFWTEDIRHLVKELRQTFPNRSFYLCGFSLGASIAANYLGQEGEDCDIAAAAVIGNPWDLNESAYTIESGWLGKYVYSSVMAQNLVKLVSAHLPMLRTDDFMEPRYSKFLEKVTTIESFDNYFTASMFGFNTSHEYYRLGSSCNRLLNVRVPTLGINALDDPIVGSVALPYREIEANPFTSLIVTTKGGHLGWFNEKNERWYAQPLARFFAGFHQDITAKNLKIKPVATPHKNRFVNDRIVDPINRDYSK